LRDSARFLFLSRNQGESANATTTARILNYSDDALTGGLRQSAGAAASQDSHHVQ
jgi:hypothetical protein